MRTFEYRRAAKIDEALYYVSEGHEGATQLLAGGTDLITLIKSGVSTPEQLIDIKRAAGLTAGIVEADDGVRLGALTTLAEIERDPLLAARYPLLCQAAASAATPQLRHMATLGGTLLQRPRCWYFRNPRAACWLKGGATCPARDGENQLHALFGDSVCCAVHPSDLATCLLALQASIRMRAALRGTRSIPIGELYAMPEATRRTETVIGNDVLVGVHLPRLRERTYSIYLKAMDRKSWSFAIVGVALVIHQTREVIDEARIALTGVAPIPWRAVHAEEALLGCKPAPEVIDAAADASIADAKPLSKNAYKIPLLRSLVRRALERVLDKAAIDRLARPDPELDEALRETFPASDAPATTQPKRD